MYLFLQLIIQSFVGFEDKLQFYSFYETAVYDTLEDIVYKIRFNLLSFRIAVCVRKFSPEGDS